MQIFHIADSRHALWDGEDASITRHFGDQWTHGIAGAEGYLGSTVVGPNGFLG